MHKFYLPYEGFIRLPKILEFFPVSSSHWWEKVGTGEFPQPIKLSPRITVWRAEDIHALIDSFSKKSVETNSKSILENEGR